MSAARRESLREPAAMQQHSGRPKAREMQGEPESEGLLEAGIAYADLFESASDIIQSVSPEGRFLYVNRAWRETLGYTREELTRLSLFDIIHPDSQAHCKDVFRRVLSGESVHGVEAVFVARDGAQMAVEGSANCSFVDGKPVATLGIFRNVTERRQAEATLRDSEEKYRILVENLGDIIYAADVNGFLTYVSPVTQSLLGYDQSEIVGRSFAEFIHQVDLARALEDFGSALSGRTTAGEYRLLTRSGETRWVQSSNRPVIEGGRVVGVTGVLSDTTGRKYMEETLRHREAHFRSVSEAASDAIITIDGRANIAYWNRAAEKTYGYGVDEVIGRSVGMVVPRSIRQAVLKRIMTGLSSEEGPPPGVVEVVGLRKDGIEFPVEMSLARWYVGKEVFCTCISRDITERKRAEDVLTESERKFRILADESPNMIFITKNGRVVYANHRCEEVMGYRTEEFYAPDLGFLALVAPESVDTVERSFSKHMRGEEVPPYEYSLLTKDGRVIEAIISTRLIDYEGEAAILGTVTDVTDRKRAEERIENAAREWRTTFDSIASLVSIHDRDFRVTRTNVAFADAFRMKPKDLIGKHCYELIHGTPEPPPHCPWKRTFTTGKPASAEFFEPHLGIDLHVSTSPVLGDDGEVSACVHVASDITERRQMEDKIRQQKEFSESLIVSSVDGIFAFDRECHYTEWNPAMERIFGIAASEALGRCAFDVLPFLKETGQDEFFHKALAGQASASPDGPYSVPQTCREGFFEAHYSPIRGQSGEIAGGLAIVRDTTDRRREQEQVQQAQVLTSLGRMTAGIAHEVRNPLASILLYAELLMTSDLPPQVRRDLRTIRHEAIRASGMMRSLLLYSRPAGPQRRRIDLNRVIRKVVDMRRYQGNVRNITVSANLHDGPLLIRGSSSYMTQLFLNLLLNAEDAVMETDALTGGLIVVSSLIDGERAAVSIADNGTGIPEEALSRVFLPFFTTKPVGKGTGLGLSACYGIVTEHKGLIRAENNEMGGATFTVHLPLARTGARRGSLQKAVV